MLINCVSEPVNNGTALLCVRYLEASRCEDTFTDVPERPCRNEGKFGAVDEDMALEVIVTETEEFEEFCNAAGTSLRESSISIRGEAVDLRIGLIYKEFSSQ